MTSVNDCVPRGGNEGGGWACFVRKDLHPRFYQNNIDEILEIEIFTFMLVGPCIVDQCQ
jgi:hypothetical protein